MCDETRWIVVDATWDITLYVWPDASWVTCEDIEVDIDFEARSRGDDFRTLRLAEYEHGHTLDELAEMYTDTRCMEISA